MPASTPLESSDAARPGSLTSGPLADPAYRAAVVDLLGVIAYGELSAFERLAEDATLAPTLEDKVAMAAMAAAEFGHVAALRERIDGARRRPGHRGDGAVPAGRSTTSTSTPRRRTGSRA